jgi:glutamine amidotransferase
MCRHLAYLGPPVELGSVLFDPPHSLRNQAQRPRQQIWGDDNPHGWAVGWWDGEAIHDYRTRTPMWEDDGFPTTTVAGAFVAAARYAAPGASLDVRSTAPLVADGWLCSLNGIVDDFYDGVGEELRARCSARRREALVTDVDTEVCFALFLDRLDSGESPEEAAGALVKDLESATTGRFNFLFSDGNRIVGTVAGNSLWFRDDPAILVSEPLDDDPAWRQLDDRTLVVADRSAIETGGL